jgi:signal peptidase I
MKKAVDWFKEFWFVWFFLLLFYVILRVSGYDLKIVDSDKNENFAKKGELN